MEKFAFLEFRRFNYYGYLNSIVVSSNLRFFINFFKVDCDSYKLVNLMPAVNMYDDSFIYNDIEHKMVYIGCAEWERDEEIQAPLDEDFPAYMNEANTCKLTYDNFIEVTQHFVALKKEKVPFALVYQDDFDWIYVKGFSTQQEMEQYVKNYQPPVVH